jgi:hypothetical protein
MLYCQINLIELHLYGIVPTYINMMVQSTSPFFINISCTVFKEFGLPPLAFFLVFHLLIEIGVLKLMSNFGSRKKSAGVRTEL